MSGTGKNRLLHLAALLVVVLAAAPLRSQPQIPDRRPLVMDAAEIISPEKEQLLTDALAGFRQTQQREVSIITVPDLQGYSIDEYTYQVRVASGLDGYNNDGAVLLVAPNDLKARIEVGSAVKSVLPDELARGIVETSILPSFEQGDMDKGIVDGTGSILHYLELPPAEAAAIAEQARLEMVQTQESGGFPWGALALLVLLFFLRAILRSMGGLFGLAGGAITLLGSGGGGGSGSGGGGFGGFAGGGGGFNGGGASGRW